MAREDDVGQSQDEDRHDDDEGEGGPIDAIIVSHQMCSLPGRDPGRFTTSSRRWNRTFVAAFAGSIDAWLEAAGSPARRHSAMGADAWVDRDVLERIAGYARDPS